MAQSWHSMHKNQPTCYKVLAFAEFQPLLDTYTPGIIHTQVREMLLASSRKRGFREKHVLPLVAKIKRKRPEKSKQKANTVYKPQGESKHCFFDELQVNLELLVEVSPAGLLSPSCCVKAATCMSRSASCLSTSLNRSSTSSRRSAPGVSSGTRSLS